MEDTMDFSAHFFFFFFLKENLSVSWKQPQATQKCEVCGKERAQVQS